MIRLPLSFHSERAQPISDIVRNRKVNMYLSSSQNIELSVSIETAQGQVYNQIVNVNATPFQIDYENNNEYTWTVLKLKARKPREPQEEPFTVLFTIEYN